MPRSRSFFQQEISRTALIFWFFLFGLFGLLRLALLLYTGTAQVPLSIWPVVMAKGLWFDAVVSSALLAPIFLYEAALPERWRQARWHHRLWHAWLFFSLALLLFGALSEFTFWMEFSNRLNFIALDYLLYTTEVIGNIRESYPVGWLLSAIVLLATAMTWAIGKKVRAVGQQPMSAKRRIGFAAASVMLSVLLIGAGNIDQMEGSGNAFADELSGNGLFTLAAAARRNELDYPKFYKTTPPETASRTLASLGMVHLTSQALRRVRFESDVAQSSPLFSRTPKNLVLVSVESLSASFLGSYGSKEGLTPNLDALARDGLRFSTVYATGTRTVRGLEALSLGTPPVPGQAIVRRPDNGHLATLGEVLKQQGVDPFFFYGGYGYFDNMNVYFGDNDYRVVDRTDIPKEEVIFENAWGVADEALFNTVLKTLDKRADPIQPFFSHVMTTSNHRPFTYPDGRIDIASPGGRAGGVKYTDYAIGKFIRDAKTKPWFKDTLFVFVADHCASVAGKSKLPVKNYQIPLIMYAPDMLKPGIYAPMISQIDIVPTLVEALGKHGDDLFFGRSIFEEGPPLERAFISNYQELGYLKNNMLTVLLPKKKVQSYAIDPGSFEATPAPVNAQLLAEAIAYYQTASSDFHVGLLRAPFDVPKSRGQQ